MTSRAISRFSLLGIVSIAILLASGLINSWNLLGGPRDLIFTCYGRLPLLKVGLFVAMVGIAAVNRFYLPPRLRRPGAIRAMQRNSLAETGLGLGIVLIVGALGIMEPTSHVHVAPADIPPGAAFVHIHSTEAMADLTIDPGRSGRVHATIRLLREDSSQFPAKGVQLALDPPAAGEQSVTRAAVRMPDGSWQLDTLDLPQSGIWTVRVIVATERGPPIMLDTPIMIDP